MFHQIVSWNAIQVSISLPKCLGCFSRFVWKRLLIQINFYIQPVFSDFFSIFKQIVIEKYELHFSKNNLIQWIESNFWSLYVWKNSLGYNNDFLVLNDFCPFKKVYRLWKLYGIRNLTHFGLTNFLRMIYKRIRCLTNCIFWCIEGNILNYSFCPKKYFIVFADSVENKCNEWWILEMYRKKSFCVLLLQLQ